MKKILVLFVLLFLSYANFSAQIRIKEITSTLPTNYTSTETREIISLNNNWIFAPKESEEGGVSINIPSVYRSDEVMVIKKSLSFLNLDISKVKHHLKWEPKWSVDKAIENLLLLSWV